MKNDILRVLITKEEIAQTVARIGREISWEYDGKKPLLIGILKGASIFLADLAREISVECSFDFMAVSSYGNSDKSSGEARIIKDLDTNIEGRHVIIVEDILDTGVTLSSLLRLLGARKPASLALCAMFDKPERRVADVKLNYWGFQVPNEFIVGYGLDYKEKYRNLPDVCVLKPEIYR